MVFQSPGELIWPYKDKMSLSQWNSAMPSDCLHKRITFRVSFWICRILGWPMGWVSPTRPCGFKYADPPYWTGPAGPTLINGPVTNSEIQNCDSSPSTWPVAQPLRMSRWSVVEFQVFFFFFSFQNLNLNFNYYLFGDGKGQIPKENQKLQLERRKITTRTNKALYSTAKQRLASIRNSFRNQVR